MVLARLARARDPQHQEARNESRIPTLLSNAEIRGGPTTVSRPWRSSPKRSWSRA